MSTLKTLACSLALAAAAAFPVVAATQFVSTHGIDRSTCGTVTSPCKTIQYAVSNRAVSGDTLIVLPGTYLERVNISISLSISGYGAAGTTIIDGNNRGIVVTIGATVTLINLTIQHGSTVSCGAGILNNSTLTLYHVTVTGNSANGGDIGSGQGGGICNYGNLDIEESTVSSNSGEEAGGIFNLGNQLLIDRSTISSNSTASYGAGIESFGPTSITNSTIANNGAIYGGGIDNHGQLEMYNCTIVNNSAQVGGGIFNDIVGGPQPVNMSNTILSGNSDSYSSPDCSGSGIASQDYNQFGNLSGCTVALAPHDVVGAALLLGPLQNNGGPTMTIAPMPGSPVIDGGNPAGCQGPNGTLALDQRRAVRGTPCDTGSVEVKD